MTEYIATFYSHYDATVFARACRRENIDSHMGPVPRKLSSSCGTCVRFSTDRDIVMLLNDENIVPVDFVVESVVINDDGYTPVYSQ